MVLRRELVCTMGRVDKNQPRITFEQRKTKSRDTGADENEAAQGPPTEEVEGDIRSILVTMEKNLQDSLAGLGNKIDALTYRMDRLSERLDKHTERLNMVEHRVSEVEEVQTSTDADRQKMGGLCTCYWTR